MQFSLRKLMLLPVAFGLAYLVPPLRIFTILETSKVGTAWGDLKMYKLVFEAAQKELGDPDPFAVNQWLAGQGDLDDKYVKKLYLCHERTQGRPDPWGRPYRFVLVVDPDTKTVVRSGFYTGARDGVSDSEGNDAGDLNTWNPYCVEFYGLETDRTRRRERAVTALVLTPFLFAAFLHIGRRTRVIVEKV